MKNITKDKDSPLKTRLVSNFSFVVGFHFVSLIFGVVKSDNFKISYSSFVLATSLLLLIAVITEWRLLIYFGQLILILIILCMVGAAVFGIVKIADRSKSSERTSWILVDLALSFLIMVLVYTYILVGRFIKELKNRSNVKPSIDNIQLAVA